MRHFSNILRLARKDYFAEWKMSGFAVLALAAVLGPMLILYALKFGMIGSMVDKLILNPHNLEIRSVGAGRFDEQFLQSLTQRPDISFVAPEQRSIASSVDLRSEQSPNILPVQFAPTAAGDPLLAALGATPSGEQIILSASAASKLKVKAGDTLSGSLARIRLGQKEREYLPVTVLAVAPESASDRDMAYVDVSMSNDVSNYRDGRAIPARGWQTGTLSTGQQPYPAFRAYASDLYQLDALRDWFASQGIDVRTRSQDAALVRGMDKNLTAIYWVVAVIGLVGYALSLAATLWSSVDRKKRDLAILRVVGYRTGDIIWFPVVQAMITALMGWITASIIYIGVSTLINSLLADKLDAGQRICVLEPQHFLAALVITIATAIVAAGVAGFRASRIEPADGLREI